MFKTVALLARKDGISHQEFVDYYENNHVPLIRSVIPNIREYRRNYLVHESAIGAPEAPAPQFDVITEIYFDDRAGYEEMLAISAGEAGGRIRADEAKFLDRRRTRMYVVQTGQDRPRE